MHQFLQLGLTVLNDMVEPGILDRRGDLLSERDQQAQLLGAKGRFVSCRCHRYCTQ